MATIRKIKKTATKVEPTEPTEEIEEKVKEKNNSNEEKEREEKLRQAIKKANSKVKKFPGEKLPNDNIEEDNIDDISEEENEEELIEDEDNDEDSIEEDSEDNDDDSEEEKPKSNSIFNKNNKKTLPIGGNQTNRINKDTIIEFYSKLSDEYLEKRKLDSLTKKENEKFYSFSKQCIEDVINDWKENLLKKYGTFDKVPEKERSILIPYIFNSNIKVSIMSPRKYPNPQNIKDLGYYSNFSLKISFNKQIGKVQKIVKENKNQYILEDGTKVPKLKK
jgi:hypothetical protein